MNAYNLDGVRLLSAQDALTGDLALDDSLLERNLLLKQVLDLLDVIDVVLIDE